MQISHSAASVPWQADSEIRAASRDLWQVVDQVATFELGGAANTERLRTLAGAGSAILERLATSDHPTHDANGALADASEAWLGGNGGAGVHEPASPQLQTVDLASVESRYIGETEKHIDRLFSDAQSGAADLWLDDADALFGKRTDVRDAHDRFAHQPMLHPAGCACSACQRR